MMHAPAPPPQRRRNTPPMPHRPPMRSLAASLPPPLFPSMAAPPVAPSIASQTVDQRSLPIGTWLERFVSTIAPHSRAELLRLLHENMATTVADIVDWTDLDFRKIGFADSQATRALLTALSSA